MKTNSKNTTATFGDFVAGAYRAWGRRRARGMVRLVVNAGLVSFPGPQRFEITEG